MPMVRLRNTESGEVIERLPLDAKEIVALNGGLYVFIEDEEDEKKAEAPKTRRARS